MMTVLRVCVLGWGVGLLLLATSSPAAELSAEVRFNRDIRPIMSDTCFKCHGPGVHKANLRLDLREEALKAAESGETPIVPGNPEKSDAIRRVFSADADEIMPPANSRKTLTPEQKQTLRRWVEQGAVYEKHWSFQTPVKAEPPKVDAATVRVLNPIDAFVADRLRQDGLKMSPEADRPTLIRRVAFTLTGLPPTPHEVDEYLADQSPDAYEKMVDRYLASERFG
jgi:hypothetical protein